MESNTRGGGAILLSVDGALTAIVQATVTVTRIMPTWESCWHTGAKAARSAVRRYRTPRVAQPKRPNDSETSAVAPLRLRKDPYYRVWNA